VRNVNPSASAWASPWAISPLALGIAHADADADADARIPDLARDQ
jgi:hypothetical protein